MVFINNITDDAHQNIVVVLADGTKVTLAINFLPSIARWAVDITYGIFIVTGLNLCVHPNILRKWKDLIPFGIAIFSTDGADPFDIEDFASGRITFAVLDSTDTAFIETQLALLNP